MLFCQLISEKTIHIEGYTQLKEDEKRMRICLELGKQALQTVDPPVGSGVIREGELIGEGIEAGKRNRDITCYAEIEAIRDTVKNTGIEAARGATLYSTHEPYLMRAYVIRHHNVIRVGTGRCHSLDRRLLLGLPAALGRRNSNLVSAVEGCSSRTGRRVLGS